MDYKWHLGYPLHRRGADRWSRQKWNFGTYHPIDKQRCQSKEDIEFWCGCQWIDIHRV